MDGHADRQTDRQTDRLQRCNASVLARKVIRVTYGQNTDQSLDVVQLSIQ